MARAIQGDDLQFRALAYGMQHPGTVQFLADRFQQASASIQQVGGAFMERAAQMYEQFNGADAIRLAHAAIRRVQTMWQSDRIQLLTDIGQFQHAGDAMARWVMACPEVRERYHKQQLDGYSDTYVDYHPGDIGESHYDYRRMMDGLVILNESPADDEPEWHADSFLDELLPDDTDLTVTEQMDIQESLRHVMWHIRQGKEDPTSKFNAQMG